MSAVRAGNVYRSTVTFVPDDGVVEQADVTVRVLAPDDTEVDWTASVFATGTASEFYVDVEVADDATDGLYRVRWESDAPSPVISAEDTFVVLRTEFSTA